MIAPPEAAMAAGKWQELTRWERAEMGRRLRRQGWTYGENMDVLPVGKGTLAGWCKEIRLSEEQIEAIKARVPSQKGIPKDTNWKRRLEIQKIRAEAQLERPTLMMAPLWLAGTVLYWAEGDQATHRLALVNSDDEALRLFMRWTIQFLNPSPCFVLALHLHHGNDEAAAKAYWARALDLDRPQFHKTFIKPPGTGHRKNHLAQGVCRVMVRRSGNAYHRTMAWIEALPEALRPHIANLDTGR